MDSRRWFWRRKVGRLGVSLAIYNHRYATSPDRWVAMPMATWDRK